MDIQMSRLLCLLVCMTYGFVHGENNHRFLITAPSVFHVGVKECITLQVGETFLGKTVSCQLETEMRVPMSDIHTKTITKKGQVYTMDIEIYANEVSNLKPTIDGPPYLNLACNVGGVKQKTRVLVSQHSGYIFIQTDQPIYNPSEKGTGRGIGTVKYRIFALDHTMRPKSDFVYVSVFNADGNRINKMMVKVNGIFSKSFDIPDVSKPGVWRITAHYKGDEKNPSVREFKVQEFVLPSFGVSIEAETGFLLVNAETFNFTIKALYTYGKNINGGFHCRFGIKEESESKGQEIKFIRGLEQTGSVNKGKAEVGVKISDLKSKLKNLTLEDLAETRSQFYIAVTVTDILSGEVQESEVFLPIVQSPYIVDLSRTRLYYTPRFTFEVVVAVHHPNGSPAKQVQVHLDVSSTDKKSVITSTNGEGIAFYAFNLIETPPSIFVTATLDGIKKKLEVQRVSLSGNSVLYMSVTNRILSQGQSLDVTFHVSGNPEDGHIYYMTLNRGTLREARSVLSSSLVKVNIPITPEMIPSFRIIGFYYDIGGDIIADSVWVDVEDTCEGKLEVKLKDGHHQYQPGFSAELEIDVGNQESATVALLAVDKAIYALGTQNKLTPKQVFASMQSYDLGCSYGGGKNTAAIFNDAGLSFISHSTTIRSMMRKGLSCESGFRRNKRSTDIQAEMSRKESAFENEQQRTCCRHGFTQIPMRLTCDERVKRVSKLENKQCVDAFRECCEFATKLRDKKRRDDLLKGHARTAIADEIEEFFDNEVQNIRGYFPPSFEFKDIKAKGKFGHTIYIPDSITTYEIQAVSSSKSHGFCVAEPIDLRVFKGVFLSLRLPYSVKRFEQLTIVVVIYNYGKMDFERMIVRMKEAKGLCSPGTTSYVTIHLYPESFQTVTFSAVPMVTGDIPIIIELYDADDKTLMDSIEKNLLVKNEGVEIRNEETFVINLDGRSDQNVLINGVFPNNTVPETDFNLFVKLEEEGFRKTMAARMLSPTKVESLIMEPQGCGEQTMIRLSPTALSIRYLDKINGWLELEPGSRDKALSFIEKGYERILSFKKPDGSYAAWINHPTSTWLTALVVKVLSLVADRQLETKELNGITERDISQEDIRKSVMYLINTQNSDGSFTDSNPVIHREMQGGVGGVEQDASLTAFITIALCRSLPFLDKETAIVMNSISRATDTLITRVKDLNRPYALAITAYCLSTCPGDQTHAILAWEKLKRLAKKAEMQSECLVWRDDGTLRLEKEARSYAVPSGVALTIETTAYALLTAVKHKDLETAHRAACFLSSQENYEGGFKSTQDTIVALEALSEYTLSVTEPPITAINAQFTVTGRSVTEKLIFENNEKKVEAELKRLVGNNINAKFSGKGNIKMKVAKAYYAFKEDTNCADVSINVTVIGKVEYTAKIQENYDYYDYENKEEMKEEEDFPRTNIEWFDVRSRRKRDTAQNNRQDVTYEVCVSHAQGRKLSGMAVADITLLSGFSADDADLEKLKNLVDRYISHYEKTKGRVLLYFNEIEAEGVCLAFGANQDVPIGLIQPAPALFYDYYEPDRKCSVLYSAPKRSKMVSILCSDDVCQCAEKGCFKERKTVEMEISKKERFEYVCYRKHVDYAFLVRVDTADEEGSFVMYSTTVNDVLRFNEDQTVKEDSRRVFVKRKHCKSELKVGNAYLIMGNDGHTKDLFGSMQYLLDSDTWVEQKPTNSTCSASVNKRYCKGLELFVTEYKVDGCTV